MNIVDIRLFASLKDLAGASTIHIEVDLPASVATLKAAIAAQVPPLATGMGSTIVAVNQEYAFDNNTIQPNDEIALFPPVSGGSDDWPEVYHLAAQPIDLNELTASIVRPETGAIALFSGYVRGVTSTDKATLETAHLVYEAYAPMAESKMKQVTEEIRQKWPKVQGIAVVQRVGQLQVSEPTVLIACAAAHRNDGCFEAARYGIDRLKEIVPVWKKEVGPDGESWVDGSYLPNEQDRQPE